MILLWHAYFDNLLAGDGKPTGGNITWWDCQENLSIWCSNKTRWNKQKVRCWFWLHGSQHLCPQLFWVPGLQKHLKYNEDLDVKIIMNSHWGGIIMWREGKGKKKDLDQCICILYWDIWCFIVVCIDLMAMNILYKIEDQARFFLCQRFAAYLEHYSLPRDFSLRSIRCSWES